MTPPAETGAAAEPGPFTYDALPGRVVFGAGAARQALAEEVERLGSTRPLLVAAGAARELAEHLVAPLGDRIVARFDGVRPHVPVEVQAAASALAREAGADCLVCIGGGSTTGAAKAVALETELPILAVPTTYAGSEMTPVWGLTEASRKATGRSPVVLPRTVIYDPELTLTLPVRVTAASGMNAIAHCVEALYAPGASPVSSLIAEEGIRALAAGIPAAVERPHGLAGRSRTLYGAYLAGSAFAVAGSGLHHRICHALGGAFGLPHAETHSIVLPHVVAFQEPAATGSMERVAAALGVPAGSAAAGLHDLAERMGLPMSLRELGLEPGRIETIVGAIVEGAPADNPRPVDEVGVRAILAAAEAGERPTQA